MRNVKFAIVALATCADLPRILNGHCLINSTLPPDHAAL